MKIKYAIYAIAMFAVILVVVRISGLFSYEIKNPPFITAMDVSNTETRKIVLFIKTQNGLSNFPYRFSKTVAGDEMTIRAYAGPIMLLYVDLIFTNRWLEAAEIIHVPDQVKRIRYSDCGPILWTRNANENQTKILSAEDFSYLEIKTYGLDQSELSIKGRLKNNNWCYASYSIDYINEVRLIKFYGMPASILSGCCRGLNEVDFNYAIWKDVKEVVVGINGPSLRIERTKKESVLRIGEIH
jgi:hypothetical protein